MFRLSFFVEDKALAEVMRLVTGRAKNLEVVPVTNAVTGANGAVAQGAGSTQERIIQELKQRRLKDFTAKDVRDACLTIGLATSSYGNYLTRMKATGLIKASGPKTKMIYNLVRKP